MNNEFIFTRIVLQFNKMESIILEFENVCWIPKKSKTMLSGTIAFAWFAPYYSMGPLCRELSWIPNLWETKKIEKTHAKEKQSHTQDNIYVIR